MAFYVDDKNMENPNKELEQTNLLNDSLLIKLDKGDDKTESGIILNTALETTGTVVKTGPGVYTQHGEQLPMQVRVGDEVRLSNDEDNYKDVILDNVKYKYANEREVMMVLKRG